nr:alpha/beta hydrolase [Streptomyces sp. CBMA123]
MLMYPMLDDRNTTDSSHEITDIGIWDRATNILAWKSILGDRVGTDDVTSYCAASRATELAGLPPTFIGVGELGLFRDENLDYAARLRAQGVPVKLHLYPGAYHAFDLFAPQSQELPPHVERLHRPTLREGSGNGDRVATRRPEGLQPVRNPAGASDPMTHTARLAGAFPK